MPDDVRNVSRSWFEKRAFSSIEGGASNLRWGGWDENLFLCKQALTPQNRMAYQVVGEAMRSTG